MRYTSIIQLACLVVMTGTCTRSARDRRRLHPTGVAVLPAASSSSAVPAVRPPKAPIVDRCSDVHAETARRVEQALREAEASSPELGHHVVGEEGPFRTPLPCEPAPGATWAVRPVRVEIDVRSSQANGWDVRDPEVEIVRIGEDGATLRAPLTSLDGTTCVDFSTSWSPRQGGLRVGDIDGDGTDEVVVRYSGRVHWRNVVIFSAQEGALVDVSKAIHSFGTHTLHLDKSWFLNDFVDVVGDARPDLVITYDLGEPLLCDEVENDFTRFTEPLVLHAVGPGQYAGNDAEARAFAAKLCPSPPRGLDSQDDVFCARLFGQPTKVLERALAKRYKPPNCTRRDEGEHEGEQEYDPLMAAARLELPLSLETAAP